MADYVKVEDIAVKDWSPRLEKLGQIVEQLSDINQCVGIILRTPKGSDPHRPEFGCEAWKYLDLPVSQAIPQIVREMTRAIELWEPRAKVESIDNRIEEHRLWLTVHWKLVLGGQETQTTEAAYDLAQLA